MELDKILERKQRIAAKKAGLEKKEQEMKTLERKARTRKLIEEQYVTRQPVSRQGRDPSRCRHPTG